MPQSETLKVGTGFIKESFFLGWVYKKVDADEKLKYPSAITLLFRKPIFFASYLIRRILKNTYLSNLLVQVDVKSVALFLFLTTQIIFPGYGIAEAGVTFIPGSPTSGIGNQTGSATNLTIAFLSLSALFFVWLVDFLKNPKNFKLSSFEIILLFFIIGVEISTIFSTYFNTSFIWLIRFSRGILVFLIFSRLPINRTNLIAICFAFISIIYIEFVLAIIQYLHGGFVGLRIETAADISSTKALYSVLQGVPVFRATGTLAQANILSFVLSVALPFSAVLLFDNRKLVRWISAVSIMLCFFTSLVTFSRWGTITLIFSAVVFFTLSYTAKAIKINKEAILKTLAIAVFALLTLSILGGMLITRFSDFSPSDSSLSIRLGLIEQAVYVIQQYPVFGIGGGTFPKYLTSFDITSSQVSEIYPAPVHNYFLLLLSELGLVSFLLFLGMIMYLIVSFFKKHGSVYQSPGSKFEKLFLIAVFTSILTYFFNGLWEIGFLSAIFWAIVGLYLNVVRNPK